MKKQDINNISETEEEKARREEAERRQEEIRRGF
jgi:hypothetical protein